LPGEREILEAKERLCGRFPHKEILPLYARLAESMQRKVFAKAGTQRIILATNLAEASLTVPGVRYVIDSGLARVKRYTPRLGFDRLLTEKPARHPPYKEQGGLVESRLALPSVFSRRKISLQGVHTPRRRFFARAWRIWSFS